MKSEPVGKVLAELFSLMLMGSVLFWLGKETGGRACEPTQRVVVEHACYVERVSRMVDDPSQDLQWWQRVRCDELKEKR